MKRMILLILCLLIPVSAFAIGPAILSGIGGACSGYNCGLDFDSNLYARWRFENDATDDGPNSEDLTSGGGTITYGTASPTPQEGTYRVELDGAEGSYFYRTDANLASGFPLKSGETNSTITACGWIYWSTNPTATYAIFSKYNSGTGKRSFYTGVYNNSGTYQARLVVGYNSGNSFDVYLHASSLTSGNWYYIAASIDSSNVYIKVRDASGNVVGSDYSTTLLNAVNIEDAQVNVGAFSSGDSGRVDGFLDEVLVFDRVLSADDVTNLAKGSYK